MSYDYLDLLSAKFKYNGESVKEGFDCMNLVIEVGKRRGIKIPNINHAEVLLKDTGDLFQRKEYLDLFYEVPRQKNAIVLLKNHNNVNGHVGFMVDDFHFIHVLADTNVSIVKVNNPIWKNKIVGYYLPK